MVGAPLSSVNNNIHARSVPQDIVKIQNGLNSFSYIVLDKSNNSVEAKDVTFVLTQPHSRRHDSKASSLEFKDGKYVASVNVGTAGRYTLQLRVAIENNVVGFSEIPAYLEP